MIIIKLYLIEMRNFHISKRITLSKFQIKNNSYFYKFNNDEQVNKFKSNYGKLLKTKINKEITSGLQFAYRNFIEAIYDKDLEFIKENCEQYFAEKLENSITEDKKKLYISSPSEVSVEISSIKFETHYGITTNRNDNRMRNLKKLDGLLDNLKIIPIPKFLLDKIPELSNLFNFYKPPNADKVEDRLVLRLNADIQTNLILSRSSSKVDVPEMHNVVFEIQTDDPIYIKYFILSSFGTNNQTDDFRMADKIIISDFDNYM
jgi:hypothetical protein